ncbi:prolyl-tRNA editing enzyme YbaK/EbsC (Cys-tRNA(Pro) deacylase) [Psychromicrobium silvestre]|uniref:Prolyl-tRNA editing enzyme YbaK/EbsC (Cys-tRNA(Pro) deacylase) n=1 Tax=Psychromicrobium silvestre TaxID=1645614 RepID=A0A7Y9LQW1_9MICC|nr:YbaK/EbsC family protein [Psychromicrobium silvestre]NYE93929.1 prolyl-tRNA editing enzyme YbaK/EbsC (Cys-tRNA(Pro) deacylase) [Psychromicrobium silvestre]
MGHYQLGTLQTTPALEQQDLLATRTAAFLHNFAAAGEVGVVEIDPEISDTAATMEAFQLDPEMLVNCVIVSGKREGAERIAACLVPATKRADINGVVRKRLDVRKASFLPRERAVELSEMEFGGITPIGLPAEWPLLVDADVVGLPLALIGSGIRKSKLILPGSAIAALEHAEIIEGLGQLLPV